LWIILALDKLTDGFDISGVHLEDQEELPLGDVHFAFGLDKIV
jgi:hypothetical protein